MPTSDPADKYLKHPFLRTVSGVLRNASSVEYTHLAAAKPTRKYSYFNESPDGEILCRRFVTHYHVSPIWNEMRSTPTSPNSTRVEYAPFWRWLAALGVTATAIGILVGAVWPGPLTGVVFPIGITILLAVAYGARARRPAAPNAR
jgi:hypothetical protein